MLSVRRARQIAKKRLSEKRYYHTLCVRRAAAMLAKKYGENVENAAVAALLHDIAKELSREEMLRILRSDAIIANKCESRPKPVWHGFAAAIIAKNEYECTNEEILNAICYHSTGRKGMTRLDKIIYMADMVSDDRDYPEAEFLRKMVFKNLDKGTAEGLRQSIMWIKQTNKPLDNDTLEAYEELAELIGGQKLE